VRLAGNAQFLVVYILVSETAIHLWIAVFVIVFSLKVYLCGMNKLKEAYKKYFPYFVDVWQYIVIVLIFIIAAIFIL
jgi:hypothetical protein